MKKSAFALLAMLAFVGTSNPTNASTLHVWQDSPSPTAPYTNWATAAHVIQEAVDAAVDGDRVLVTNGFYTTGGRTVYGTMTNRVAVDRAITLLSVNGPEVTVIVGAEAPGGDEYGNGDGAIRGVYLGTNAVLSGFTVTNGHTRRTGNLYHEQCGGGMRCEGSAVVTNSVLVGNTANERGGGVVGGTLEHCRIQRNVAIDGDADDNDGEGGGASNSLLSHCILNDNLAGCEGGGASYSILDHCAVFSNVCLSEGGGVQSGYVYNCTLFGNFAGAWGGGVASKAIVFNCTVTGNSANRFAGGADDCTLYNSIVHNNIAPRNPNYRWSKLEYCLTSPLPTNGLGNIDADPAFRNAAAGDFRLAPWSPCIDAASDFDLGGGTNLSDIITTDLAGLPRVVDGNGDGIATFDMGAYEYQPTPAEVVGSLIQQVSQSNLLSNRKTPLLASLEAAQASFEHANAGAGVNQLQAFQNKVRAQIFRLDSELAKQLTDAAQKIIDGVQGPP